tara:strand:+ start:10801 stop:11088 length:288 start_codon:yes stop_codon:yes gene_type:complete
MKLPLPKIRTLSQFILLSTWSNRAIAKHLDITHKTVADYRKRLQEARLAWSKIKSLDDDEFHKELFPSYRGTVHKCINFRLLLDSPLNSQVTDYA